MTRRPDEVEAAWAQLRAELLLERYGTPVPEHRNPRSEPLPAPAALRLVHAAAADNPEGAEPAGEPGPGRERRGA